MSLPLRRSRFKGCTSSQKFKLGTKIEKEELERSICDDEEESTSPKLNKKPKLSLNDKSPTNKVKTPIAVKGWNTCSTGFSPKSISKSAKLKRPTPKFKRSIIKTPKTTVKNVSRDSECIVNESESDSKIIVESPISTPKKNESTPDEEDLSQSISAPNTPDSKERKDDSGTKWIQQIMWKPKTPEKSKPDLTFLINSGKKRKPVKGGFAENLRKLEVREKSSKAIWQLEKSKSLKKVEAKLFLLRVLELEKERSLIYAKSVIETSPSTLLSDNETSEIAYLVLNSKLVDEIAIKIGSLISLHPPWQRLKLGSKTVIFPSPYLEVLNNEDCNIVKENVETILQAWSCPCRSTNFHPNSCPMLKGSNESKLTQKPNKLETESNFKTVTQYSEASQESLSSCYSETPESSQEIKKPRYSVLKEVEKSGGCDGGENQIRLATIQGKIESIVHSNSGTSFAPKSVQIRKKLIS